MTGTVFDIKEFSLHDGPGSRVTVFLKGCPLRCVWCHNPEGLKPEPQLMFKENMCVHCGECFNPCSHIECKAYDRCLYVCPNNCLNVSGKIYEAAELAGKLVEYVPFFGVDGGVTFSGGEPMMQADFLCEVIDILKNNNIHTAIQTSGYTKKETFRMVIDEIDYIMMDIKLADRGEHKKYTGVYNDVIFENLRYLKTCGKPYIIRVPLIPDITDTEENLKGISKIVKDSPVELLSYNTLAGAKYKMLGMEYSLGAEKNHKPDLGIFENAILS